MRMTRTFSFGAAKHRLAGAPHLGVSAAKDFVVSLQPVGALSLSARLVLVGLQTRIATPH